MICFLEMRHDVRLCFTVTRTRALGFAAIVRAMLYLDFIVSFAHTFDNFISINLAMNLALPLEIVTLMINYKLIISNGLK